MSGLVLLLGSVWPFLVAVLGLFALHAKGKWSDGLAELSLIAGFLGTRAVFLGIVWRLPGEWSDGSRLLVTTLLTFPLVCGGVFLAICLFAHGALRMGLLE